VTSRLTVSGAGWASGRFLCAAVRSRERPMASTPATIACNRVQPRLSTSQPGAGRFSGSDGPPSDPTPNKTPRPSTPGASSRAAKSKVHPICSKEDVVYLYPCHSSSLDDPSTILKWHQLSLRPHTVLIGRQDFLVHMATFARWAS